jgi:hypothetical protein
MITYIRTLAAIFVLGLLAACGGGSEEPTTSIEDNGGTTSGENSSGTSTPPAITLVCNLSTIIPMSTYAPGSDSATFFAGMNPARIASGAGAISQSTLLDAAASAHAAYEIDNLAAQGLSHYEASGSTGYTGDTPDARIKSAGYAAALDGELIGGADCVGGMLNSVNHATIFLGAMTSVGFGTALSQYRELVVGGGVPEGDGTWTINIRKKGTTSPVETITFELDVANGD